MASSRRSKRKERDGPPPGQPRPFWSGVIAFGLVSLPVGLYPANRGKPVSLKMVDRDGAPLRRRYFCEKEERPLELDDIVRGYQVDTDQYVIIEDDELESLVPEKTREIDLRRFVSLPDINPIYFERGYFLAPDSGATKAYRLLAQSMEEEQRAGIATFVMRDKEYIIAIIAEQGILRAETLRFHDEIRTPEDVGLPERRQADGRHVKRMTKTMKSMSARHLDRAALSDRQSQRIRELAEEKLRSGRDVVRLAEESPPEEPPEETNVVDLMQVLKDRLQGRQAGSRGSGSDDGSGASRVAELVKLSRSELYDRARQRDIPGRSGMTKQQLAEALTGASANDR